MVQEEIDWERKARGLRPRKLSSRDKVRIQVRARQGLRCAIARKLLGDSYRSFTCRLADSGVLQKFCLIDRLCGEIKVPGKSRLQRDEALFSEEFLRDVITEVTQKAAQRPETGEDHELGLAGCISLEQYFFDTTCLKANIHFPVDWKLLRDATRTLMKAVRLIRSEGLLNRMQSPQFFMRQMNRLCIEMTQARRQKDSKRTRKKVLRKMKKLVAKVARHAKVHRELLIKGRERTRFSQNEAARIVQRIDSVLEQLPRAVYQAHERIIGQRLVPSRDKILSLYEQEIHVIVRGKADAETEFGNKLLLVEQADGMIVDWELFRNVPGDSQVLKPSLQRMEEKYQCRPRTVVADRGLDSAPNRQYLKGEKIENNICPKSVPAMQEKLQQVGFCEDQKRRGQTEARISILKNRFLGSPLRSKGFMSRQLSVGWAVLAHNLWVLARLPRAGEEDRRQSQAA